MPKLMVVMCLGAVLLSTAPISQTFAQVKQQEAQASGIAVEDTLSNSGNAVKADPLRLLRPGATAIFPVPDSAAAFKADPLQLLRPLDPRLTPPAVEYVIEPIWQQESKGWTQLANVGPGRDAIVTLTDGTLRGGQIVEVQSEGLRLLVGGNVMTITRSDIASVRVKRKRGTLIGGVAGYLISGVTLTAIVCTEAGSCSATGVILGVALLGIPGGLLGALIGSQVGGDVEIVP